MSWCSPAATSDELGLLALRAGAVGFLSKEADIDALPRALEGVRRGEAAISREMTRRLIDRYRGTADGATGLRPIKSPLTAREWEVIDLLKPDRSPEHVAETLVLSPETVRSHIKNIMRKLDVHSRADAVAAAERLRIASPDRSQLIGTQLQRWKQGKPKHRRPANTASHPTST